MKRLFFQVNVFSNSPFGGNPLAVFMDVEGLTIETMQKIAKEMKHSETTFVLPPGNLPADFSFRIFSPGKELPFAGHPTLGTAHILRETGKVPDGDYPLKLATKTGIITVTQKNNKNLLFMSQQLPEFQIPLNYEERIGEALGIPKSSFIFSCPMQIVSTGLPVLIVPIISLNALKKIVININKLKQVLEKLNTDIIYAFTQQTINSNASIHSRAFAPGIGIAEDPATGSAAGAVGAYLFKHDLVSGHISKNIHIEQGYQMGRPSSLYVEIDQENKMIKSILVGGESVTVIEGWANF